ncbi:LysR family transcriptional regulator [Chimaeribacter arupi]|uniref:LysR family transcriptional regulator n=2 Tax=Chimaeribacter arupi TaxID=2060066 RepID=A0A2N5EQY0_9GAMM|nr:LysR family transcriptional regulator [Chimaeribacter arupi]PLR45360.1 LysR family transcriptional regulator [Chimaeribacter arupi]PLR52104.1 LysR family transcriptional regulator [Chimaeribacter arupi]
MMELSQLRCFVAVAEELHFGRAARRLFMTQPPLSRQIQLLEHTLGVTLLTRSHRQVRLTASGESFLRDARQILAFTQQAEISARRVAAGVAGRLTLGFTAVCAYSQIPALIAQASRVLPDVEMILKEMVSAAQVQALVARTLDVAFVRQPQPLFPLEYLRVLREPLVIALPAADPLAAAPTLSLSALHRQPFIMYSPNEGKYFYDCIVSLFSQANVLPRYVQFLSQTHTILALVKAGLGMAIVPASAQSLRMEGVTFRPLPQAGAVADVYMAWRQDCDNPALAAFRNLVTAGLEPQT